MKNTKLLALVILLLAVVAAIYRFWGVVCLFFAAAIVAYLLSPLVKLLTLKGKVPRGIAVAVTALLLVGLITWGLVALIPYAVNQIGGLVNDLSTYAGQFDDLLARAQEILASWHLPEPVLDWISGIAGKMDTYLMTAFKSILTWLMNTTSGLFDMVVVMILVIYFMLDGSKMIQRGVDALPDRVQVRVRRVLTESNGYVWKYVGTRVLISLGMAVVSFIGFQIMGLHYALLFAVMSFVLDFIPYFGSTVAGIVEGVFALITGGLKLAITVVIFVIVVQQIEGNIVMPRVQGNAVNIHPVWVMFSLLACSEIWGPVGMLISTPVAAVVRTVVREIYYYIIGDEKRSVTAAVESDVAAGRAEKEAALAAAAAGNAPAGAPQAPAQPVSPPAEQPAEKPAEKAAKAPAKKPHFPGKQ